MKRKRTRSVKDTDGLKKPDNKAHVGIIEYCHKQGWCPHEALYYLSYTTTMMIEIVMRQDEAGLDLD